jgi:acyl carrier protein
MSDHNREVDASLQLLLRKYLPDVPLGATLSPEENLADLGADSLVLVELIMALEDEYGIVFTDDLLTPETFETVGSLAAAVRRLN